MRKTPPAWGARTTSLPLPTTALKEKIHLKLITIETFNGEAPDGHVDAGAYDWLKTLKVQIELGETLNNRTWPEKIKCGILASHLSGSAATWYTRNCATLLIASFCDLGMSSSDAAFPFNSRPLVLHNKKLSAETYLAYSHRLSVCAAGLNRGKVNNFTEQQALCTFINHTYPTFRDTMLAKMDAEAEDASTELQAAVVLVTKLANSDG
ncbi:hypothetical protein PF003_g36842 [Phytophthora fragariae]|nr:hypothetical protein PF003_g36842 [Phytophthora fragariae]